MTFTFNDEEKATITAATHVPDEYREHLIENFCEIESALMAFFQKHNNLLRQYNATVEGYRDRLLKIVRDKRALYGDRITRDADDKLAMLGKFAAGLDTFEEVELELDKAEFVPPRQNPFKL